MFEPKEIENNVTHESFIGIYDGFFTSEFCDNLIDYFNWCQKNNKTYKRPNAESIKKDDSVNLNPHTETEITFAAQNLSLFLSEFNDVFWNTCYKDYINEYSILANYEKHTIYSYKIQKTSPGGGYHIWHAEDGELCHSRRIGVYILYLNDVDEGGETEFLYCSKRIPAKKGRLVIFPPNYPWAHRGNPPLSGDKYIMTGWTEFS